MLILKTISLSLDIQNCISLCTDLDNNIKRILESRYVGRCLSGCYIQEISRIVHIGHCVISQDGDPTFGSIPVTFEVIGVVYMQGEIINNCLVERSNMDTGFICSTKIASIMVQIPPELKPKFESISVGQIISVRVARCGYKISSNKISVGAIPFVFAKEALIYKISPADPAEMKLLENVFERITDEEAAMKKIKAESPKMWDIFDQLLYAYKEPQKNPPGAEVVPDVIQFVKENKFTGLISRDNRLNLSTKNAYKYQPGSQVPYARVRVMKPIEVYTLLLEDYCAHLRTVREMVEIYSSEQRLTEHRNLWQIFRGLKM